jgi:hypothetical protein
MASRHGLSKTGKGIFGGKGLSSSIFPSEKKKKTKKSNPLTMSPIMAKCGYKRGKK